MARTLSFASAALLAAFTTVSSALFGGDSTRAPQALVTGIAGVTFLTRDLDAMRRYYGLGAGFTEESAGATTTRFLIGSGQWIEFTVSPQPAWPRRLQSVTLVAPVLGETLKALAASGILVDSRGATLPLRSAEVSDPAGNRIAFTGLADGPSQPKPETGFSRHLQHVGVAVDRRFQERTIAFYRDVLGLAEYFHMSGADGRLELLKMRMPGPRDEVIELIFVDPPLNKWASGAIDHICFEVDDINAAYRVLHANGIATEKRHLPTVNAEHLWAIDVFDPELTRMEIQVLEPSAAPVGTVSADAERRPEIRLFDGKTLSGWEGNRANWRVEQGSIVAGELDRKQPYNEFLTTASDYGDFDLRLQYRIEGTGPFVNGGVQFWSQRVPGSPEVSGYQADLGAGTDGNLYDESRRNRNLAEAPADARGRALRAGDWNDYRIRAEGSHIQIWLNGIKTVDFIERDPGIARSGKFALQIHGTSNTKVWYRGLTVEPLKPPSGLPGN